MKNPFFGCWIFERFSSFHRVWKQTLISSPKTYIGLYSGIARVTARTAKKPEKVLKEWCIRTENQFGECKASDICHCQIIPLVEKGDKAKLKKTAARLLKAAKAAGIHTESEPKEMILSEKNATAYIDLNDNELFEGDRVKVISPAWFQNGKLIEQGYCSKE